MISVTVRSRSEKRKERGERTEMKKLECGEELLWNVCHRSNRSQQVQRCSGAMGVVKNPICRAITSSWKSCVYIWRRQKAPQGGKADFCGPNIDKTSAALAAPQSHPSADVSAASQPSLLFFFFCQQQGTVRRKAKRIQFLAHPSLFFIVDLETLYSCGKFLSDSKPLEFETAD